VATLPPIQHILDVNRLTCSDVGHHPDCRTSSTPVNNTNFFKLARSCETILRFYSYDGATNYVKCRTGGLLVKCRTGGLKYVALKYQAQVHIHVHIHIHIYTYTYTYIYMCIYCVCVCVCVCECVCMCVCVCVCVYICTICI
jgi:hypothetical protein